MPDPLVIRFSSFVILMIPTLSQLSCLNSPSDRDLEDFAAAGCQAVEVWLTKLETYLETHTLKDVRYWLEKTRVSLPVASYQGGLLSSQGEARREAWDLFTRRLDLCRRALVVSLLHPPFFCDCGSRKLPTARRTHWQ